MDYLLPLRTVSLIFRWFDKVGDDTTLTVPSNNPLRPFIALLQWESLTMIQYYPLRFFLFLSLVGPKEILDDYKVFLIVK